MQCRGAAGGASRNALGDVTGDWAFLYQKSKFFLNTQKTLKNRCFDHLLRFHLAVVFQINKIISKKKWLYRKSQRKLTAKVGGAVVFFSSGFLGFSWVFFLFSFCFLFVFFCFLFVFFLFSFCFPFVFLEFQTQENLRKQKENHRKTKRKP